MNYSYFCGSDISKNHVDFCLLDTHSTSCIKRRSGNTIPELITALQDLPVGTARVLLCAEHTGMYGYNLSQAAQQLGMDLWFEHPAQINACSGVKRGKTDPMDAQSIALYALRYQDRVRLAKPATEVLQKLEYVQSERALLVADRAKYKGQLRDQKEHMDWEAYGQKAVRLTALIEAFTCQIQQIDEAITELIGSDLDICTQHRLLQSIPGVGPRLSLAVLVATKGFTSFSSPRAFSCHCGVAPFVWHSGESTHSRARVSHRADKRIKSLLHMGALSAVNCPGELQQYYQRKVEEGKPKMSVINAVRSKLIHRMFAVIKKEQKYSPVLQQRVA